MTTVKRHRHRWGRKISGVFNGPIRVCQHLKCGAVCYATGYIGGGHGGFLRDRTQEGK